MKTAYAFILLIALLGSLLACKRVYVYKRTEGGGTTDTLRPPTPGGVFPSCAVCATVTPGLSKWNFAIGSATLCGSFDKSVINIERNLFTFFGPSACAADTGLILTVSTGATILNKDLFSIGAPQATMIYYHTGNDDVLENHTTRDIRLVIDSYIHATRIATGHFSGKAYKTDSSVVYIDSGQFMIKL